MSEQLQIWTLPQKTAVKETKNSVTVVREKQAHDLFSSPVFTFSARTAWHYIYDQEKEWSAFSDSG